MSQSPPHKQHIPQPLPGFGASLKVESHLPIAQKWYASPITVRERAMLSLMSALKDKAEWDRKVFDESIVRKWRGEALQFRADRKPDSAVAAVANAWKKTEEGGENGQSLDLDGEQRQTIITDAVFDYVSHSIMRSWHGLRHCSVLLSFATTQNSTRNVALRRPLTLMLACTCPIVLCRMARRRSYNKVLHAWKTSRNIKKTGTRAQTVRFWISCTLRSSHYYTDGHASCRQLQYP